MKIHEFCIKEELTDTILLSKLRGNIFHATNPAGFAGILTSGYIESNHNNVYAYSSPQSQNSYGRKRDYVCLFDLREVSDDILKDTLFKFDFLNPPNSCDQPKFLILNPFYHSKLISNQQASIDGKKDEIWIPKTECWHPGKIPIDRISECISVGIIRKKLFSKRGTSETLSEEVRLARDLFECRKKMR